MQKEQLKPNIVIEQLQERLMELNTILKNLKATPASKIKGRLRISQKGKYTEYYHVTSADKPRGKYIPKKLGVTACQLAQKDYDTKIISIVEEEIAALKTYLTAATAIQSFYTQLCPARQKLITPLTLSDDQYTAQWKNESYKGLPFSPDAPVYTTIQGERVRSKSEVLIANALTQHTIPYRYEYPLKLRGHHSTTTTLYPDFLCLNLRTRREFIWEHFGLMDSPDYVQNAVSKITLYTLNKITPGKNFIITMETAAEPLTPSLIEQMINDFLL